MAFLLMKTRRCTGRLGRRAVGKHAKTSFRSSRSRLTEIAHCLLMILTLSKRKIILGLTLRPDGFAYITFTDCAVKNFQRSGYDR